VWNRMEKENFGPKIEREKKKKKKDFLKDF